MGIVSPQPPQQEYPVSPNTMIQSDKLILTPIHNIERKKSSCPEPVVNIVAGLCADRGAKSKYSKLGPITQTMI